MRHSTQKHRSETGDRHPSVPTSPEIGCICEISPTKGFGRIETPDGRVILFYKDCVVDRPFERLTIGTEVRFAEESGKHGPQASVVQIVD